MSLVQNPPNPPKTPKSGILEKPSDNKSNDEEEIPSLSHQQISVVVVDKSKEEKTPNPSVGPQDCFGKLISILFFSIQFVVFLGLGIACLVIVSEDSCPGTPALESFLNGIGAVLIAQSILVLFDRWYFRYHRGDDTAKLFQGLNILSYLCIFILMLFGIIEVGHQILNNASMTGPAAGTCDPSCEATYGCSDTVFYSSMFASLICALISFYSSIRLCNKCRYG